MLIAKRQRKIRPEKIAAVQELTKLIKGHKIIGIASLYGLRASQMQELRKILRGIATIKVAKNTLMKKAIEISSSSKPNLDKLLPHLKGQNAFLFSNENPFTLALTLEKYKVLAEAKPGDIAPKDIVIYAGNTGITPGPIMSKFSAFKVPVKIEEGSIWVTKDTVVARKGDVISPDLADLLKRLGIKPIEVKLGLKVVYFDGHVLTSDDLYLNLDEYKNNIANAFNAALALCVESSFITPESAPLIIRKAFMNARAVAIFAALPEPETLSMAIQVANARAIMLATQISQVSPDFKVEVPKLPTTVERKEEEKKEEKKVEEEEKEEASEEEIAEGLAALFG